MKLLLTDFYHQPTARLVSSLRAAKIDFQQVNITYDGWLPLDVHNPFAYYTGMEGLPDKALHYNQIEVPDFAEIRNADGATADIILAGEVIGKIIYEKNTARLVKEIVWLDRDGKLTLVQRYNRQGKKFADALFDSEGKEVKTIYYHRDGQKVLTIDTKSHVLMLETAGAPQIFNNLTDFVLDYLKKIILEDSAISYDEVLFNSLSTSFFAALGLTSLKSTLYFQEVIRDTIPGNMQAILDGKTSVNRILFENAKELKKVQSKISKTEVSLDYLGAIEAFSRQNTFRRKVLTITRSDQILYDEAVANELASLNNTQWTIAAPSEVSDKLHDFANKHKNVTVIEAMPLADIDQLLKDNDIYLDLNKGQDTANVVQRAYLEGLLVIGDQKVGKNLGYELILGNETEILQVLRRKDKDFVMNVLRTKKGSPASNADYKRLLA